MKMKAINLLIAIALGFSLSLAWSGNSFAKDKGLTPEEVVAAHLKSIGAPELLAKIQNRGMSGKTSVEFINGGVGTLAGQAMVLSSGHSLSIILKYGGVEYPGEYFAFDGKDVEVSTITPGTEVPFGRFYLPLQRSDKGRASGRSLISGLALAGHREKECFTQIRQR